MSTATFRILLSVPAAIVIAALAWTACAATEAAEAGPKGSGPAPRMPLSKFLKDERMVAALRRGVEAMKARKPYDPLSWFYQAAIHGVPDAMVAAERAKLLALKDVGKVEADKLDAVFKKRYWNQCPHNGEESANFLPWHRAYTYYFEKILRMHTGEATFSLPYWDYEPKDHRKFPKEFGVEFLDPARTQPNVLFHPQRDFYFTRHDHLFAVGLPLLELTDDAVDGSRALASPVFFGHNDSTGLGGAHADENPTTRGLLEQSPHDHVHRAVGGFILRADGGYTAGAMAEPPTAGFDPIFPMHHSNIDRLWAVWSCMPDKRWGNWPPDHWFNARPWYFWDIDGHGTPHVVNEPRRNYFSYKALGIRFEDPATHGKPLELPDDAGKSPPALLARRPEVRVEAEKLGPVEVPSFGRAVVRLGNDGVRKRLDERFKDGPGGQRVVLRLAGLDLGLVAATGYDVHVTAAPDAPLRRADPTFVGSVALFRHRAEAAAAVGHAGTAPLVEARGHGAGDGHGGGHGQADEFEITAAVARLSTAKADLSRLSVVLVPYPLLTVPGKETVHVTPGAMARIGGVQLLMGK